MNLRWQIIQFSYEYEKRHVFKQICHQVQWFVNMFSAPLSIEPVEKYVCKYNFMSLLLLLSPRTIMDPPALSLDC